MPRPLQLADSPIRQARVAIKKTIGEAAEGAGVNWQTWFLTENGCYEDIPGRIIDYLGRINVSTEEYFAYRESKQKEFGESHNFDSIGLPPVDLNLSPIESFRKSLGKSRADFAKSLATQVAHLYNCEKGRCRFIPSGLRDALLTAGLPMSLVDELDERQQEFYERNTVK